MNSRKMIAGKRVLLVDDEKDVLETLSTLLDICKLDTALSFEEAKKLLNENEYDVAILDIMGVKGFELLEIAKDKGVAVLMLTAHGLSEENLKRSAENGASYYAPKEEMSNIASFVADILEAKARNASPWLRWLERLGGYFDRRFGGRDWREKEKKFWDNRVKPYD